MKITTQVEEYHYICDCCDKRVINEKSVATVTYMVRGGDGYSMNKRTRHFCYDCAKKKGIL